QLSPATTVQPGWNGRPAFHEAVRVGQLWSLSLWRSGCRDDDRHGADGSEGEQAREESEEGAREGRREWTRGHRSGYKHKRSLINDEDESVQYDCPRK